MSSPLLAAPAHVLVIDDEPEIGDLVAAAAGTLGLGCTSLTSAQGMEELLGPHVAVVVVDLMMPGMDGIELVRRLAERGCEAHVVLMSGHDRSVLRSAEQVARTLGLRTAGPLQKPFRIADVEALLLSFIGKVPEAAAAQRRECVRLSRGELETSVARDDIVVHYQPQISLADGALQGVEALVRLQHPERGLLYPDSFIEVAESGGLIEALTDRVMERALRDCAGLRGLGAATVSINVSVSSLQDLQFPDRLAQCASRAGFALERVVVEITESGLIQEFGRALDVLARLRLRGVGVSIDDFGTGYSSMAQLRRVPCTELKIDRSFVQDMMADDSARIVVEESIGLAHRLNLHVVAEGVESPEQAAALRGAGCEFAQGFFYSRPVAPGALAQWLAARECTGPLDAAAGVAVNSGA